MLVLGDLSFLHDLTSIVAAQRLGLDLLIVLIDNDGGGIFSFLPQGSAQRPDLGPLGSRKEINVSARLDAAIDRLHKEVNHNP